MSTQQHDVNIKVNGQNNAKAVLVQTAKNVKSIGDESTKSADAFEYFGRTMGDTALGQVAIQGKMVAEQFKKIGEAGTAGSIGVRAMQAGLIAMVGVVAFGIGKAISSAIFQTKKWEDALAAARQQAADLNEAIHRGIEERHSAQLAEIDLIDDADAKRQKQLEYLELVKKNLEGAAEQAANAKKRFDELNESRNPFKNRPNIAQAKDEADEAQAKVKLLREQRVELERATNGVQAEFEARKQAAAHMADAKKQEAQLQDEINKLSLSALDYELQRIDALKVSDPQKERLANLIKEKQHLEAIAKTEQERRVEAEQDAAKEQQRLDQNKAYVQGLKEQAVEITRGKTALAEMREQAMGLTDEQKKQAEHARNQIAWAKADEERAKNQEQRQKELVQSALSINEQLKSQQSAPDGVAARSSRFLRGTASGGKPPQEDMRDTMKQAYALAKEQAEKNDRMLAAMQDIAKQTNWQFAQAGGG